MEKFDNQCKHNNLLLTSFLASAMIVAIVALGSSNCREKRYDDHTHSKMTHLLRLVYAPTRTTLIDQPYRQICEVVKLFSRVGW